MPDEAALLGQRVWPDNWRHPRQPATASDICKQAGLLVSGDREAAHGDKAINHRNIADMWNAYLGAQLRFPVTPRQAALMMALLKIARTKLGAHNPDDYVDGAGYMACAGEIADGEDVR